MSNFMNDLDIVDPETIEPAAVNFPVAQWLNGDPKLAAAGGVAHTGGLILPDKYLPDDFATPAGWTRAKVAFNNGKTDDVLAAQKPALAIIRTRFRWFVSVGGVSKFYPRASYVENAGMRGHVQALCAFYGFAFPVVVTFKGKASQEFERLAKEHATKVQEAAQRAAKAAGQPPETRFPRFAFYMRLGAAPHVKVGQKGQDSIVTPPVLELPSVISPDYLGKIYVGRDRLVELQRLYHDTYDWAVAWDRAGAEGEADEAAAEDEAPAERGAQPTVRPAERPVDNNGLAAHIKGLRKPSEAHKLLDAINGPTVYWTVVKVFGLDQQIAEDIRREAGDWKKALAGLDSQTEPF